MYQSYIIEVNELSDTLDEINENKWEIVSVVHVSESQQLIVIVKMDEEKRPLLKLFNRTKEIEDE